jgi:hypothetical protein
VRVGGECHHLRGGGGDSSDRACMCKNSARESLFLAEISTLLVLSPVYNTGCKEGSVVRYILRLSKEQFYVLYPPYMHICECKLSGIFCHHVGDRSARYRQTQHSPDIFSVMSVQPSHYMLVVITFICMYICRQRCFTRDCRHSCYTRDNSSRPRTISKQQP